MLVLLPSCSDVNIYQYTNVTVYCLKKFIYTRTL